MAGLLLCRAPQARPARGPANMTAAASCGMAAADDAAETLDWLTNQAGPASAQAIPSQALQDSTRGVSWPPLLLGSSMRKRSWPANASTTSGVSSRRRSISAPCASSSACTARARCGALAARAGGTRVSMNVSSVFQSIGPEFNGPAPGSRPLSSRRQSPASAILTSRLPCPRRLVWLNGAYNVVVRCRLVEFPQETQLDEGLGMEIDAQVDEGETFPVHDEKRGGLQLLQFTSSGLAGLNGAEKPFGQGLIFVFLEGRDHCIDDSRVAQNIARRCAIATDLRLHDRCDLGAIEDRASSVCGNDGELSPSQIWIAFLEVMDDRLGC